MSQNTELVEVNLTAHSFGVRRGAAMYPMIQLFLLQRVDCPDRMCLNGFNNKSQQPVRLKLPHFGLSGNYGLYCGTPPSVDVAVDSRMPFLCGNDGNLHILTTNWRKQFPFDSLEEFVESDRQTFHSFISIAHFGVALEGIQANNRRILRQTNAHKCLSTTQSLASE
jgi:hypothetical protein